jgi:long-chain-fatty-acid--CoA ligase ACSBG
MKFAASLIAYKFKEYTSVNIIGFNAPEWAITFYGTLFARAIATGIYTTNSPQVC